ncbi:MAG: DNA mismatch repair endonuclease MutL [Chthoniobacterales bacterium]
MGKIHLLSDVLASQVAAGEVVERPASVLKELVENSIDAGATRIIVEFQRGGVGLLRVTDDGSGMDSSDALLALERHATSKIRTAADLAVIDTLGFRGEALPSIASVSRFRLITRLRGEADEISVGTEVEVHGGKILNVRKSGENFGTRMEVKDLFYNVPARRKFLKSEQTEAAHIIEQLQLLAVAHPEIAFTCLRDDREIFRLGATGDLAVRLRDLYGASFLQRLEAVPRIDVEGVVVSGFFAKPGEGRSDRSHQMLFVNGRLVRSNILSQPLREACDGILAKGLHPQAVLFFEIDPATVDCNVHPAKREVRFHDPVKMRAAALRAAAQVTGNFSQGMRQHLPPLAEVARPYTIARSFEGVNVKSQRGDEGNSEESVTRDFNDRDIIEKLPANIDSLAERPTNRDFQKIKTATSTDCLNYREATEKIKFRYLGRLAERYLLLEEDEGLVLLEVRAAFERITYDSLLESLGVGLVDSQRLLIPEIIEVSPAQAAWVMVHQETLKQVGFDVDEFGRSQHGSASCSLKIDAVPVLLADIPVTQLMHQLIDALEQEDSKSSTTAGKNIEIIQEKLARSVSHIAAAAKKLPPGEEAAVMLVHHLLKSPLPYATPFGRPTMIQLSAVELHRKFSK